MKAFRKISLLISACLFLAIPSVADQLKFQQLPLDGIDVQGEIKYFGHDELSSAYLIEPESMQYEGCFMADDFADTFDTPVIRLKWWGSYFENFLERGVQRFMIVWETDVPADQSELGYSIPGTVIQSEIVTRSDVTAAPVAGEFSETAISPGGAPCFETLYEYEAVLANPFYQKPNTVYWLKIVALFDYDAAIVQDLVWNVLPRYEMTFCEFLNMPIADQMNIYPMEIPMERWGWHDRDYTKMDPYASVKPNVIPGEYNLSVPGPDIDLDYWHFQDDAVSGGCSIGVNPDQIWIEQWGYMEEYYKYFRQFCGDLGEVDGPEGIEQFSKDLAFELYTEDEQVDLDFGDAPEKPYPTTLANSGANHVINFVYGPWLGDATDFPDPETDGQPTAAADGDDINGGMDDEDGVTIPVLVIGQSATITFEVNSFDAAGGNVEGYIDFDGSGTWDASEQIVAAGYPNGVQSITFTVPSTAVAGTTYARFRISRTGTFPYGVTGQAPDGEVEDYVVTIEEEPEEPTIKFRQLPLDGITLDNGEVMYFGHDEFSTAYSWFDEAGEFAGYQGCYMADDFADLYNTPVISLKWWGSYILNEDVNHVQRFLIVFEKDVPASGEPGTPDYVPSHPGDILSSEIVTINGAGGLVLNPGEFSEVMVNTGGAPCYEPLYEYRAVLKNPFPQEPHTVYWLKIVALVDLDIYYVNYIKGIMQQTGLPMCELFENPTEYDLPYILMWGWHNRDYTINDPYASVSPDVIPGENVIGQVIMPDQTVQEVWHFQDDAVYGDVVVDELAAADEIFVLQNYIERWREQYYKYSLPYCGYEVDGPVGIEEFSKDLAFELYTECGPCLGDFNGDGVINGSDVSGFVATFGLVVGQPGYNCLGDFNGDNAVNGSDVAGFIAVFGTICP